MMLKSISTLAVTFSLILECPTLATHPNAYYWWQFINSFSNDLMKKWIEKAPKQEAKKQVAAEEDDLFGDSPAPAV